MENLYALKFKNSVTSYYYYNEILKELHEYFLLHKNSELIFDFTNVDYIDAEVIPILLATGCVIKDYLRKPISLFIPWKPKLLSYLCDIGFIDIVRNKNIFLLDERFIGGYAVNTINPECNTYCFEKGTSKDEIYKGLKHSIGIISEFFKGDQLLSESRSKEILEEITEISHNACNHSESMCFVSIVSNLKKGYATISISDYGVGYYKSFEQKIKNGNADLKLISEAEFSQLKPLERNIYSILEGIFHRENSPKYGLYHVVNEILDHNGFVRIHTNNTQLVIKNKSIFINKRKYPSYLIKRNEEVQNGSLDIQKSPIRDFNNKFNGVHIELQIPLLKDKIFKGKS